MYENWSKEIKRELILKSFKNKLLKIWQVCVFICYWTLYFFNLLVHPHITELFYTYIFIILSVNIYIILSINYFKDIKQSIHKNIIPLYLINFVFFNLNKVDFIIISIKNYVNIFRVTYIFKAVVVLMYPKYYQLKSNGKYIESACESCRHRFSCISHLFHGYNKWIKTENLFLN